MCDRSGGSCKNYQRELLGDRTMPSLGSRLYVNTYCRPISVFAWGANLFQTCGIPREYAALARARLRRLPACQDRSFFVQGALVVHRGQLPCNEIRNLGFNLPFFAMNTAPYFHEYAPHSWQHHKPGLFLLQIAMNLNFIRAKTSYSWQIAMNPRCIHGEHFISWRFAINPHY